MQNNDSHKADRILTAMPIRKRDKITDALWAKYGRNVWSVAEVLAESAS